jgi:hypothetical protein
VQEEEYGEEVGIPERQVSLPVAGDHQGHLYPLHLDSTFGAWEGS